MHPTTVDKLFKKRVFFFLEKERHMQPLDGKRIQKLRICLNKTYFFFPICSFSAPLSLLLFLFSSYFVEWSYCYRCCHNRRRRHRLRERVTAATAIIWCRRCPSSLFGATDIGHRSSSHIRVSQLMGRLENGGSSSDLMIQSHLHQTCRYLQPVSRRAWDSRWAALRNTIISMYQPSDLATLVPTMQQFTESATQSLLSHKEEDIIFSDLSLKLATDVIRLAAFGINFGLSKPPTPAPSSLVITRATTHEVSDFINEHVYSTNVLKMDLSGSLSMIIGLLVPLFQEPFRRMLKLIPCTMDWKVERTDKKLSRRLNDIVSKRIQETERGLKDFLSLIFNARDLETVSGKVFTLDYITALTFEHLLAGSATTAFILSSVGYLVVGHPEVEKKLLDEIDGYGAHDCVLTAHDLQDKFPYLNQVIKEAMSFYKVSPLIARETVASVEVGGYLLPKGTWVWLAPGVLARDPKNFPDADKFRPERFDLNDFYQRKEGSSL